MIGHCKHCNILEDCTCEQWISFAVKKPPIDTLILIHVRGRLTPKVAYYGGEEFGCPGFGTFAEEDVLHWRWCPSCPGEESKFNEYRDQDTSQ